MVIQTVSDAYTTPLALKWFGGDGNVAEEYEGGRELEDLVKLCVALSHPLRLELTTSQHHRKDRYQIQHQTTSPIRGRIPQR